MNSRELPDLIELELDLQGFVLAGVVPPTNPVLLPAFSGSQAGLEVVRALESVGQLSESASQLVVPVAVVGGVEELLGPALVALGHGVGHHPVVPGTPVELDAHADGPPVVAVGQEPDLAGPNWGIQGVLDLQVGVLVPGYHL